MKSASLLILISIILLVFFITLTDGLLYAAEPGSYEIKEMSSKKNSQLFDKIAVDLLNGNARFVSLDNMIGILRDFDVIDIRSAELEPAKEMILKEVAFRMLKSHYLPRSGDKIYVSKADKIPSVEANSNEHRTTNLEAEIMLPVEVAEIKDNSELSTIHWQDMTAQVSKAIEKLWLKRIGHKSFNVGQDNDKLLLDATVLLRRKFIHEEEIESGYPIVNEIVKAVGDNIEAWFSKGVISYSDIPIFAEMAVQYIILSDSADMSEIIEDLKGLRDLNDFMDALLYKIKGASDNIRNINPADYGALAMLQSLLSDISSYSSRGNANTTDRPINMDLRESYHSA